MKKSLKDIYTNTLNEFRVSIETDDDYYDYEFEGDPKNINFKKLNFTHDGKEISSEFKKEIHKTEDYIVYKNPKTAAKDTAKFGLREGSILQYIVLKALKNIVIYENKTYGYLSEIYINVPSDQIYNYKIEEILIGVFKFLSEKYKQKDNEYLSLLDDLIAKESEGKENLKDNIINFCNTAADAKADSGILSSDFFKAQQNDTSTIYKTIEKYFKRDFADPKRHETASIQHSIIANEYMADGPNALSLFYRGREEARKDSKSVAIRRNVSSIEEIKKILILSNSIEQFKQINNLPAANRKGKGEFLCHMLFRTSNACLSIEPDVVIQGVGNFSVKSMDSKSARTGENLDPKIKAVMVDLFGDDLANKSQITKSQLEKFANEIKEKGKEISDLYDKLKIEIITEHDAIGVILHENAKLQVLLKDDINPDNIFLTEFKNNRWTFEYSTSILDKGFENVLRNYNPQKTKEEENEFESQEASGKEEAFSFKGKVLKEVYSHLFEKKVIEEGGLAGHMMHPYEALDMTPREMIARIKEYGVPQSIIEKVDGQNLFFTVEKDGTLLFARNKEDMTHDDLVQKFTGHPAELPFVEGGNAIKRGVDQWLSSAGDFASQEILDIFHPDEETRSFINFEIMHPEKPNQIIYDEKYIVFHNITDFVDGREQVYSSSTDGRLQRLITLMESGVNSGGFVLASNREVDLNKLTDTQIARYIDKVKDVVDMLEISEDQYLADGILSVIDKELKSEGVNISEEALSILKDFVIYGQTKTGESIKSKDFTELMDKEDVVKLRKLGLTSATKVLGKVSKILSPFKDIFVDLGIDLLSGVKSSYMSAETSEENINVLRDKLQTAMNDLDEYMLSRDEEEYSNTVKRLIPHINKIKEAGLDKVISSSVEGGVYDYQADLIKVTGGFAPMNQILGAAYRDKEDIFPMFKEKFMQKEGNRKSLKDVFSLIY